MSKNNLVNGLTYKENPQAYLKNVGILLEPSYYDYMSATENLRAYASLSGVRFADVENEIKELLDVIGLGDAMGKKVREFSFGMKQKLGVAMAFVKKPDVLVLDEPSIGVDPKGLDALFGMLKKFAEKDNMAIIFSSNNLQEVQDISDRISFLKDGKIIQTIGTQEMLNLQNTYTVRVRNPLSEQLQISLGAVSADAFGLLIWSFLKYLIVLYLVPVYISCSFLGKEIESRSINIMLSDQKRGAIFWSKVITYVLVCTLFFALFMGVSVGAFLLFMDGTEFAAACTASVSQVVFAYLFQYLELIFILLAAVILCCVVKGNAALLLGIMVVIVQRVLVNMDGIKKVLPQYISDYSTYATIPQEELASFNTFSLGIYAVVLAVLTILAVRIWQKRDF
ncbi:MAG: ABC transporter ATP-binding protein [Lachnospiraceae bacterium]|nr:ABC transporter ATP-binding protein [Lachnospiraceae bacterium]